MMFLFNKITFLKIWQVEKREDMKEELRKVVNDEVLKEGV